METPSIIYSDCIGPVNAFVLEVSKPDSPASSIMLYVTADRADFEAKRLSLLCPGLYIRLTKMARIKAIYENGKRTKVTNYHDFYEGLTEEQYAATLIKDSDTAEML